MIDVRSHGASAGGSAVVNGQAFADSLVECRAKRADLYVPDGVFDVDRALYFGTSYLAPVALVGDGHGQVRRSAGRPLPKPGSHSWHLVWDKCASSVIRGVLPDGNARAYPDPAFVGDTVRVQFVVDVDHEGVVVLNSKGSTTRSIPGVIAESFARQYLNCGKVRTRRCGALQLDGGEGATGVEVAGCDDFEERDSIVAGFSKGQGYAVYGGKTGRVRFVNAHSIHNHHGFNVEASPNGLGWVSIGDGSPEGACSSTDDTRGLVVNGNDPRGVERIEKVTAELLRIERSMQAVAVTGTAPGELGLLGVSIIDPTAAAIAYLTNGTASAAATFVVGSTWHNGRGTAKAVTGGKIPASNGALTLV
jgi:hypothetical protein